MTKETLITFIKESLVRRSSELVSLLADCGLPRPVAVLVRDAICRGLKEKNIDPSLHENRDPLGRIAVCVSALARDLPS